MVRTRKRREAVKGVRTKGFGDRNGGQGLGWRRIGNVFKNRGS